MRMPVLFATLATLSAGSAIAQADGGQPFRVFFDWAKPELTRDAQAILDEAVAAYQQSQAGRVEVAGHTDRSGSTAYNLAASRRRAEAVKTYLTAHGIPASAMVVSAYGESRPIVATEDGVREAQNRRVEIAFKRTSPKSTTKAPLVRSDGSAAGSARLQGQQLAIEVSGLAPGPHGLHLHAVGRCEGPDFAGAGPHWNPANRKHGSANPQGPHLGDLPNLEVGADGRGAATFSVPDGLVDGDGAALVIHASPDDYRTDPSGNSGARIACAAFTR
jgi:Cu-Zn family superoxide dismutase